MIQKKILVVSQEAYVRALLQKELNEPYEDGGFWPVPNAYVMRTPSFLKVKMKIRELCSSGV